MATLIVGMGCFWGAERLFWQLPGVYTTAVGYSGGHTPNPTYEETCTSMTGHTEAVLVVFDPEQVSLDDLLAVFWENHDPTQYMGQGNDIGSQYRSAIYTNSDEQLAAAEASRDRYQARLDQAGYGTITTEIAPAGEFSARSPTRDRPEGPRLRRPPSRHRQCIERAARTRAPRRPAASPEENHV